MAKRNEPERFSKKDLDDLELSKMGQALTDFIGTSSALRAEVANELHVDRSTVIRWCESDTRCSRENVLRIERFLDLPLGSVERAAGYVEVETTIEAAINAEPTIDVHDKQMLLALLESARQLRRN